MTDLPDPQPLPPLLPPVIPFDLKLVPGSLRSWIDDVAERIQCPPEYAAVPAMITVGGVVGRQVGIRPKKHDDWLVVPNLWGAIVGAPGMLKSPPLAEALRPLRELEQEARRDFEAEAAAFEAKKLAVDEHRNHVKTQMRDAIKKGLTPDEVAKAFAAVADAQAPVRRRYLVQDTTVEKLGEILSGNPNGIVVVRDELVGFLSGLEREGQECSRAFYLEAWNGTAGFCFDRIGRGTVDITSCCVSLVGGIQPGPLARYVQAAVKGFSGDDGLIQRLQLVVYPDVSGEWKHVDRSPNAEAREKAFGTVRRLSEIQTTDVQVQRGDGKDIPFLRFARDAQDIFDNWRGDLEHRLRAGEEHPILEGHLAKNRSLIPSLALISYLADGGTTGVDADALHRAIAWAEYLESHARRVYSMAISPGGASMRALARRIFKGDVPDEFSRRDVYRRHWEHLDREGVEVATDSLVDLGWLLEDERRSGGRPSLVFTVNPKVRQRTRKVLGLV